MNVLAWIVSREWVANALIHRARSTPYEHLEGYMHRWWLFNGYRWDWLPSIRIHHILRADEDRHLHDHPWNWRTVILRGWYIEMVEDGGGRVRYRYRFRGNTSTLKHGQFHRIADVSNGGVWTLFITWRYRGTWGFKVNGVKVPHREYRK